jgi:hypothetical protein
MITRIALFATLGCLIDALGFDYTTSAFWCLLALFIAQGYLSHQEGYEQAEDDFTELLGQALANLEAANEQLIQARDVIINLEKNSND